MMRMVHQPGALRHPCDELGIDTRLYLSADKRCPARPEAAAWMGGEAVWKIELDQAAADPRGVSSRPCATRRSSRCRSAVVSRCDAYFENGGLMVEHPFQAWIEEGMIGVYLTHNR